MYLEVYLDVIFIINFIMDFILLYMVKMTLKRKTTWLRLILSSAFGAIIACILTIFPNINMYLQFLFSYIVATTIMILIAFPAKKIVFVIKACLLLYISTFFMGGILNSLYYHTKLGYYFTLLIQGEIKIEKDKSFLVISLFAIICATFLFIRLLNNIRSGEQLLYKTELYINNKKVDMLGLLDTGNNLYDPLTRKPVLVMDITGLISILSKDEYKYIYSVVKDVNCFSMMKKDDSMSCQDYHLFDYLKLRMIPFHSIGKSGLLPAIMVDQVIVWNDEEQISNENVLVAVSEDRISKQNDYRIILHRAIM